MARVVALLLLFCTPVIAAPADDLRGQEMLVAFAGDRDLARTETLARMIVNLYPDTRFADYRRRLELTGHKLGNTTYGQSLPPVFANEVLHQLELNDPSLKALSGIESGPASVDAAKKWVNEKLATMPDRR